MKRAVAVAIISLGVGLLSGLSGLAQTPAGVPAFAVDASWPKPLPNGWVVGQVAGVAVDSQDHIWILHRPATLAGGRGANAAPPKPGVPAPPVIEFDAAGNLVQAWGGAGAGYEWPINEHGLSVDSKRNVWVTGG